MILCLNFSRPWEGEEIAETITLLQKTSETAVTTGLIALENLMQCDIAQLSWWSISLMTTGNPPRFESNQGLQRAAVLPSTWAAAPCHWTRRMILTRSDKKLLTPHWHLGQIGWMTRWFFCTWSYFFLLTAVLVVCWLGKEGWMVTPLQEPHRHLLPCWAAAGVTPLGNYNSDSTEADSCPSCCCE